MAQKAGTKSNAAILTILLFLAYLLSAFFKTAANVAVPEFQKAIGLSASAAGIISGMFFFPYAFLQLATGSLCEKFSAERVVAIGLAFAMFGSACWALADSATWI
jgi:sugar phosphate permease